MAQSLVAFSTGARAFPAGTAPAPPTAASWPGAATPQRGSASAGAAAAVAGLAAGAAAAAAASRPQRKRQAGRGRAGRRVAAVDAPAAPAKADERKDLGATLPDCPSTIWKADDIDIDSLPEVAETAPLIIDALELGEKLQSGMEAEYFAQQREAIMEQLQRHGAILFRNFGMMKDAAGFRAMYEALQLNPCLDPIHTSGLREMVEKKDAVYEAVNKPSLAQHFVGLHNESTFVKTATYGAFVCFKPATEGGGEFIIADGAKIISDMDKDVLRRLYERKVRISVSNLDLNFVDMLPEFVKDGVKDSLQDLILKAVAPKFDMDLEMVYGADSSNPWRLQAIEHAQSPINRHPVTGQPVWFCNLHNHSRYLRDRRPCTVPEVGMTDVYHGDLGRISPEDVRHVNDVCEKNIVPIMMEEGDVVLLDNYRVLHGRKIFKGERNHAVTWFESCGEPLSRKDRGERPDDFMNNLINKTLV
uniref:TauD/TfdA-like domain-containing protein n=1 Tax=Alexandrium monilatum TaxID=311494 RepID=A0A7S4ST99_9DINO